MEGQVYECPGCFSSIPADCIDFKVRRAVCPSCGNLVILTRKAINGSQKVVYDLENAIRFFMNNDFDSARRYAESALSISVDNAAALFILAYHSAYIAPTKTRAHIEKFFKETLLELEMDYEEIDQLKTLLTRCLTNLVEYEKDILKKLSTCQSQQDLATFVDGFSPFIIARRDNMDYLDAEMVAVYSEISAYADVPKTWYALYQSISKNPDSPELNDNYFLDKKVNRFYNDYVLGVEKIFASINNGTLKAKFNGAFSKIKEVIKTKMNNGGKN